jgi:hypothetical protein
VNSIADLVLAGWLPLALVAFACLSPRRAGLVVIAVGTMLLPIHSIDVPAPWIPDLTKRMAISLSIVAGVLCFDARRVLAFRAHWLDLVTAAWILAPALASLANGHGPYDALQASLLRSITWGVPYLFGRLYLNSEAALRECLWVVFLGGLVYAPLALYEVVMSPQLHRIVYGAHQHIFSQTFRGGGWRPMVFMHHGLELTMWLAWATASGFALWRLAGVRRLLGVPIALPCLGLLATVALCKSTGALLLLALTIVLMAPRASRWLRLMVLAAVPAFLLFRVLSDGSAEKTVIEWIGLWSQQRADSVAYRFDNEALLLDNVRQNPLFGLGGWRFLDRIDPWTGVKTQAVSDSYWILALSTNGAVGLLSFLSALWLPARRGMAARQPARVVLACSLLLGMSMLDLLFNAFVTPMLIALTGGLMLSSSPSQAAERPTADRRPLRPRSA